MNPHPISISLKEQSNHQFKLRSMRCEIESGWKWCKIALAVFSFQKNPTSLTSLFKSHIFTKTPTDPSNIPRSPIERASHLLLNTPVPDLQVTLLVAKNGILFAHKLQRKKDRAPQNGTQGCSLRRWEHWSWLCWREAVSVWL